MKYLGQQVGFPVASADVRIAQYESGNRTPKADLIQNLQMSSGFPGIFINTSTINSKRNPGDEFLESTII